MNKYIIKGKDYVVLFLTAVLGREGKINIFQTGLEKFMELSNEVLYA